jgi:putative tricarboxylic transport membrane protein
VILFPLILLFCVVGVYSINNTIDEVILMTVFGIIGYLMKKYAYEAAPMVMAMILSPLMENNLRQSLALSHGSFLIFFTRPLSAILMITAIALLILPNLPWLKAKKWKGLEEAQ